MDRAVKVSFPSRCFEWSGELWLAAGVGGSVEPVSDIYQLEVQPYRVEGRSGLGVAPRLWH